jgi:RNA polymerase sigma-70 factor (ECF subfamily)
VNDDGRLAAEGCSQAEGSEARLVSRLREGDEAAFRELVRSMHRALARVALAFVGTPEAAEEVVQETWLVVVSDIDRFEGRASLRTWIGAILVNRAKTRGARDKRTIPFSALGLGAPDETDPVEPERFSAGGFWTAPPKSWDPEDLALRKEACEVIERTLAELPPAQRTIVNLRDLEGWSSEEVCNVLDVTETNQRVLLHRGRMRLRAALEGHYTMRAKGR